MFCFSCPYKQWAEPPRASFLKSGATRNDRSHPDLWFPSSRASGVPSASRSGHFRFKDTNISNQKLGLEAARCPVGARLLSPNPSQQQEQMCKSTLPGLVARLLGLTRLPGCSLPGCVPGYWRGHTQRRNFNFSGPTVFRLRLLTNWLYKSVSVFRLSN